MTDRKRLSVEAFEAFERDSGVFSERIDGARYWERVRLPVFNAIQERLGRSQAHDESEQDLRSKLKGGYMIARNLVRHNPFLASPADLVFVGSPRRKRLADGLWWDIYCDPIHEALDEEAVHLEPPHLLDHKVPTKTPEVRYLDLIEYAPQVREVVTRGAAVGSADDRARLDALESEISDRFDVDVDVGETVRRTLADRRLNLRLYGRLLDRLDPEILVLVCSYGKEDLVEACKAAGVTVVELQHGIIDRCHLGYSFHGNRTKETFPHYLFTFGEFWSDGVELPIPDNRVIPVGYPYLEQRRGRYAAVDTGEQVLFVSQGTVGEHLSTVAVDLARRTGVEVVYKLHPGEYERWRDEYPWLVDSTVTVVDGDDPPLYRLFAESSVQVGVSSTALYEGLTFGLRTYLLDLPGVDAMEFLTEQGYATVVTNADEIALNGGGDRTPPTEYLFEPNAVENITTELAKLADGRR